jgi:hypothetical protein
MATDISSLVTGLDGHVVRLGIVLKGLRKNGEILRCTNLFHCIFFSPCTATHHYSCAYSLWRTTTNTFCATAQLSPPSFSWSWYNVSHSIVIYIPLQPPPSYSWPYDTRLAIQSPVLHIPSQPTPDSFNIVSSTYKNLLETFAMTIISIPWAKH